MAAESSNGKHDGDWTKPAFLRRVRIRGYKSIESCDVRLHPLTVLVGRNAAGKSNFLDALAFLRDVVSKGVHEAVKLHGGPDAVRCRLSGSSFVSVEIEAGYQPQGEDAFWTATFAIEIAMPRQGQPRLVREHARLESTEAARRTSYTVEGGRVSWGGDVLAYPLHEWLAQDRVMLGVFGTPPFLELTERIESIGTYNFNPEAIRRPQKPSPGGFLERDGGNLASVIEATREVEPWAVERVGSYFRAIADSAEFAGVVKAGGYESLQFRVPLLHEGVATFFEMPAASMSDGTLSCLAALTAAFQLVLPHGHPSVVGIEEPETALHPAALRALADALDDATQRTQILLTTHSPDLLAGRDLDPGQILVVRNRGGRTHIAPIDPESREILRRELSSLSELQRMDQLELDEGDAARPLPTGRPEGV